MQTVDLFQRLGEKLVLERAHRFKVFDDANPEVGMPPSWQMYINNALKSLIKEGTLPQDFKMEKSDAD